MNPLNLLTVIPFVGGFIAIKNYRWFMKIINKLYAKRKEPLNQIELKAKIIASSIFVMLWSVLGFILLTYS